MEFNSGLGGRMFSNMGGGMRGFDHELPLQHQPQPQSQPPQLTQPVQQNPPHHQPSPSPSQIVTAHLHHELDRHQSQQPQLSQNQAAFHYPAPATTAPTQPHHQHPPPQQNRARCDEDEPNNLGGNDDGSGSGDATEKIKASPWHRMKWTDNMVRLLIMAVYFIEDENVGSDHHRKKSGGGGSSSSGALIQKKGKWKSVSRAMSEKGFHVSPQQCEDKFNDLNKRHKRVNDILGKGTACKVVEDQSLLETTDLEPNMKQEVKRLLNSKHCFFREMCAYHNGCGHVTNAGATAGGSSGGHHSPDGAATVQSHPHRQHQQKQGQQQQQVCFPNSTNKATTEDSKMVTMADAEDEDADDNDEDGEEDQQHGRSDDDYIEGPVRKTARKEPTSGSARQITNVLANNVMQDRTGTSRDKKRWLNTRFMQLQEQGVMYQYEAYKIERQRIKWMLYSTKKEREFEKIKLENERKMLENERMVILLKQKELELAEQQNLSSMIG